MSNSKFLRAEKADARRIARQRMKTGPGIAQASCEVASRLEQTPEFINAKTTMVFVSLPDEVETSSLIERLLQSDRRVVIPYCEGDDIRPFILTDTSELQPGAYGILEPAAPLREDRCRVPRLEEIDLVVVPGVAFDRHGGRVGRGRGYYDRFLPRLRPDAKKIAIAFERQMLPRVPVGPGDVPMDAVVTEQAVYRRSSGSLG